MSVTKFNPPLIAIVVMALALAGCASLGGGPDKPRVGLASIRVLEIRGLETTFEIDLRIINPSQQSLSIEGIDCELTLNDRQLAEGVAKPQVDIGAYEDAVVSVKVYSSMFDMIGIARRLVKYAGQGEGTEHWTYAISGHLQAGGTGRLGRIPFDARGTIDLEELAQPQRQ